MIGRRTKIWIAGTIGGLVLVAGLGEAGLRILLRHRISSGAQNVLGSGVDVGIGSRPALIDATTGRIPTVTIRSDSAEVCNLSDVAAAVNLSDVRRKGGQAHASQVNAMITLSGANLSAAAAKVLSSSSSSVLASTALTLTGLKVQPDPAHQQLIMRLGPGGVFRIGESVRLEPAPTTASGQAVPSSLIDRFIPKDGVSVKLDALPLGLEPTSARVTGAGLRITLHAGGTDLSPHAAHTCPALG
jgi:hypothetical protein